MHLHYTWDIIPAAKHFKEPSSEALKWNTQAVPTNSNFWRKEKVKCDWQHTTKQDIQAIIKSFKQINTSSILIRMSLPFPFSCSLLDRIQSTKFSRSLQDMVWILLGKDSSSMFLANSWTARERSLRGKCCRTWWTRSARVLYARGLQPKQGMRKTHWVQLKSFLIWLNK